MEVAVLEAEMVVVVEEEVVVGVAVVVEGEGAAGAAGVVEGAYDSYGKDLDTNLTNSYT